VSITTRSDSVTSKLTKSSPCMVQSLMDSFSVEAELPTLWC